MEMKQLSEYICSGFSIHSSCTTFILFYFFITDLFLFMENLGSATMRVSWLQPSILVLMSILVWNTDCGLRWKIMFVFLYGDCNYTCLHNFLAGSKFRLTYLVG
jgi:hypothetical protein